MKSIVIYVAIVLAALISCTGAEAKRHHSDGKSAITKTVSIVHSTSARHRRGVRQIRYTAYAGYRRARRTRHYSIFYSQQRAIDGVLVDRDGWRQTASWDNSCFSLLHMHSMYACSGHGGG
jgi:hypothetical protein